jgi:hypothetical protein
MPRPPKGASTRARSCPLMPSSPSLLLLLLPPLLLWRSACPPMRPPGRENDVGGDAQTPARERLRVGAERQPQRAQRRTPAGRQCDVDGLVLCVALVAHSTRARAACVGQEPKRQSLLQNQNLRQGEGGGGGPSYEWREPEVRQGPLGLQLVAPL